MAPPAEADGQKWPLKGVRNMKKEGCPEKRLDFNLIYSLMDKELISLLQAPGCSSALRMCSIANSLSEQAAEEQAPVLRGSKTEQLSTLVPFEISTMALEAGFEEVDRFSQ